MHRALYNNASQSNGVEKIVDDRDTLVKEVDTSLALASRARIVPVAPGRKTRCKARSHTDHKTEN